MRPIEQLKQDFDLYFQEIERCEKNNCHWALLHILLALPDVCASLEADDPNSEVGDRYVEWCKENLPDSATFSAEDRYQMRNAVLHSGSSKAQNLKKKHHSKFKYFSYIIDPKTSNKMVHGTSNKDDTILNVQVIAMAAETKKALQKWFENLQKDTHTHKMANVEQNIARLIRMQRKNIPKIESNGNVYYRNGITLSST